MALRQVFLLNKLELGVGDGRVYWATTTRRLVAPSTVAWGVVVMQVTAVVTLVQLYQSVPFIIILMVPPTAGAADKVKVTESMLPGLVAFRT